MDRRTFESPMDWEYQNGPPVDQSSPFAKFSQKPPVSSFDSPSKFGRNNTNPFETATPSRMSPFKQDQPRPPHASFFNPQLSRKPSAPQFRNPAFTTPQRRVDELAYSEFSGAESSPAMTDTSEMPVDTPETDRRDDLGKASVTTASRSIFSTSPIRSRTPGRGEIARGNRDKVRKRKRLQSDRDVGSVRSRLPHDSDESDSDWEDGSQRRIKGQGKGQQPKKGMVSSFLAAVSDHPSAPAILSKWLQLGVNIILLGIVLFGILAILSQIRSDLYHASEKAREALVAQAKACERDYIQNHCFPKESRPRRLEQDCNEWEACMNQNVEDVLLVQVSAKNLAEIMNEFVGVLTFKTWGFIMSLFLVAVVASNIGFGHLRESTLSTPARPAESLQSPAAHPLLGAAAHDPSQAYIWAPIQTPGHRIRRNVFANEASDTDNSPDVKSIMPPQTPSGRRSLSKGERGRSPAKGMRSPSKGY